MGAIGVSVGQQIHETKLIENSLFPCRYALANCLCIDIKQKAGCLSNLEDPKRLKGILAQTLTSELYTTWKINSETLLKFSQDAKVQHFTSKYLKMNNQLSDMSSEECISLQIFAMLFYNSLTKDRIHELPLLMDLLQVCEDIS